MCRANSDPRGGYRCIDFQKSIAISKRVYAAREANPNDSIDTHLWIPQNLDIVPTLGEIENLIGTFHDVELSSRRIDPTLAEITHIGGMITRLADSRVGLEAKIRRANRLRDNFEDGMSKKSIPPAEIREREQEVREASLRIQREVRESVWSVMAQFRDFGGPLDIDTRSENHSKIMDDVTSWLPSDWNSSLTGTLRIRAPKEKMRSIYRWSSRSIYVAGESDNDHLYETFSHEIGHAVEDFVPHLARLNKEYVYQRSASWSGNKSFPLVPLSETEKVFPDGFTHAYIGKDCGADSSELLSCGLDSLIGDRRGGLIGLDGHYPDPGHRNLTIGVLAAINVPQNNGMKKKISVRQDRKKENKEFNLKD